MSSLAIGLIGYGYWGPNLLRNFAANAGFRLAAVAEGRAEQRGLVAAQHPTVRLHESAEALIDDAAVEAVVIATPEGTHYSLAKRALERRKHVLVEKPLCTSVTEGEDLVALAERQGVTLMVDHTFLFTGAVREIHRLCRAGELGRISYYDSVRINLGLFRPDVNVLWDLGPHDVAIMDYVLGEAPIHIEASGYCHVDSTIPDIVYLTLHFASDIIAHIHLSWMSPVKIRHVMVGGHKKMLVWDDLDRDQKIKIYDSGVDVRRDEERAALLPEYRIGDIFSPRVSGREALAGVVEHFHRVIAGKEKPIMGGRDGLRVVGILEQAQQALDKSLTTVAARKQGRPA